jgi:aspartyl/asparaginyl-tRNA synthetase
VPPEDIDKALKLFEVTEPFTREELDKKKQELLTTWHPHRYAMVTNNPRKYMAKYKQAEAMTKDINAAYDLLVKRLEKKEGAKG